MALFDFFRLLNSSGILTGLVALLCITGTLWWTWQCSLYVGGLCLACQAEICRERESPQVLVQASPNMTAEQLADLLREAETIIQIKQAALIQS